ncbi:LytTr DNA-binding domain-containing protein [Spirosomataceae bacterium TFI 002]|nr:LytTr DNA-binding domain-containing protein [Spirosomataceae bacterium TFI 002]
MNSRIKLVGRKIVETNAIILLKADANYTEVHMKNGEKIIVSKTLKELEKKFIIFPFFRCHKSYMVNMNQVESIQLNGGAKAKLANNTYAEISRRRKDAFIDAMKAYV